MSFSHLDYVIIAFTGLVCVFSFFTGFLKRLSGAVAVAGACVITHFTSGILQNELLFSHEPFTHFIPVLEFILLFIIIKLIVKKISKGISDVPLAGTTDKTVGFLLGLCMSVAFVFAFSVFLQYIKPDTVQQSLIMSAIIKFFHL